MQKFLTIFAVFVVSLSVPVFADSSVTYKGNVSGIDCNGCKRSIASSISKLKGVKTIRIVKKGTESHELIVITDGSKSISKAQAVKALGKGCHYSLVSWAKS